MITITEGEKNTVYTVVLHSTPVMLDTLTTDANGTASGSFVAPVESEPVEASVSGGDINVAVSGAAPGGGSYPSPAGFTGPHTVEFIDASGASASSGITLPTPPSRSGDSGGGWRRHLGIYWSSCRRTRRDGARISHHRRCVALLRAAQGRPRQLMRNCRHAHHRRTGRTWASTGHVPILPMS